MKGIVNWKIIIITMVSIFLIAIYTIVDNRKIKVINEEVIIENLPEAFDGYTILQITDLHGKRFGEKQEDLINLINSLQYDIIAITGDIENKHMDNIAPFLEMIKGIENKENIFFVFGNADDEKYYDAIKKSGCNMLEEPVKISRENDYIWLSEYDYQKEFDKEGISVALTHIPIPMDVGHDLIIAGHYHGGQYRIPGIGALFIPDINGKGLLPKEKDVSGVQDFGKYKQYISKGLGASSNIKIMEFRFFNTPEINLIKLKCKK